jgi:hypothetical protein
MGLLPETLRLLISHRTSDFLLPPTRPPPPREIDKIGEQGFYFFPPQFCGGGEGGLAIFHSFVGVGGHRLNLPLRKRIKKKKERAHPPLVGLFLKDLCLPKTESTTTTSYKEETTCASITIT